MNKELTLEEKFNKVIELLKNRLVFSYIADDRTIDKLYPPNKERDIRFAYIGMNSWQTKIEKNEIEKILEEVAPEVIEEAKQEQEDFKKEGYKKYEGIHGIVIC